MLKQRDAKIRKFSQDIYTAPQLSLTYNNNNNNKQFYFVKENYEIVSAEIVAREYESQSNRRLPQGVMIGSPIANEFTVVALENSIDCKNNLCGFFHFQYLLKRLDSKTSAKCRIS